MTIREIEAILSLWEGMRDGALPKEIIIIRQLLARVKELEAEKYDELCK